MADPKQTLEEAFCGAVPASFGFLVSEYGFSLVQEHSWLFRAESQYCQIAIYLDRNQLNVDLERVSSTIQQESSYRYPNQSVDVVVIALCFDPQADVGFNSNLKPEEVCGEMDRYAELLRRYCGPMLGGDFSDWQKLEACIRERGRLRELKVEEKAKAFRLSDIRLKAETAWHEKDYAQVVSLYESIQEDLTPAEAKKLEYARKRL